MVFQRLKSFALRLNVGKCQFGKTEPEFLGHMINSEGFKPIPEKFRVIAEYPKPRTVNELTV